MYYFSYGSNISTPRMQKRVPSAKVVAVGGLNNHELKFHKVSKDGSSKCDIFKTLKFTDVVYGVIYEIRESEKASLDHAEGLGLGYEQKLVKVSIINNQSISALTYYATKIREELKLYHCYKEHVVRGAIENNLPSEYVTKIESVESERDPEQKRNARELLIYST